MPLSSVSDSLLWESVTNTPFITLSFRSKIGREGFYEQYVFADA